jgi:hypothetical protein
MCTALCQPYFTKVLTLRAAGYYTNCIHVFRVIVRKSRQDMYVYRRVHVTTVVVEKHYVLDTHSECVSVALVIQHAKRMRRHMWPVWLYHIFSHYLINGAFFRCGKVIEEIVFSDFLYNLV